MRNFRRLVLGLVLVSLAGVSWGEPSSELVLYCTQNGNVYINQTKGAYSEWEVRRTFKIGNVLHLPGPENSTLPISYRDEEFILASGELTEPEGITYQHNFVFRNGKDGWTFMAYGFLGDTASATAGTCEHF
jgi:hypothetical protein